MATEIKLKHGSSEPSLHNSVNNSKVIVNSVNIDQKKISDKILIAEKQNVPCYSFEYFPPKSAIATKNLIDRICRMELFSPLFIDITDSKTSNTLELAKNLLKNTNINTIMVHLSMTDRTKDEIIKFLTECKNLGIKNILALRGGLCLFKYLKFFYEYPCTKVKYNNK